MHPYRKDTEETTQGYYVQLNDDDNIPATGNLVWDHADPATNKIDPDSGVVYDNRIKTIKVTRVPETMPWDLSVSGGLALYVWETIKVDGVWTNRLRQGGSFSYDPLLQLEEGPIFLKAYVEGNVASASMRDAGIVASMGEDSDPVTVTVVAPVVNGDNGGESDKVDDQVEESTDYPARVFFNDNDSDKDEQFDYLDSSVNGPYDLTDMSMIDLQVLPLNVPTGSVVLSGAANIRLFGQTNVEWDVIKEPGADSADLWTPGFALSARAEGVGTGVRGLTITYKYIRQNGSTITFRDKMKVGVFRADLDIDSDQSSNYGGPDHSDYEDVIEEGTTNEIHAGLKYIVVDDYYGSYTSGVPAYAENLTFPVGPAATALFVPVTIKVHGDLNDTNTLIQFMYSESDPDDTTLGYQEGEVIYTADSGNLRLWTENQSAPRSPITVTNGGDFIPSGEWVSVKDLAIVPPARLKLYLEGISPSGALGEEIITVNVKNGSAVSNGAATATDIIKCTVIKVDVDVDSNNDDAFLVPERNKAEDHYEDMTNRFGKLLVVNDNDDDGDGIPDYADGYNLDKSLGNADDVVTNEQFVPIVFELPEPIDVNEAVVKLGYSDSNPKNVVPGTWELPEGNLRIWTTDGSAARNRKPITSGGDFVKAKKYSAAEFGFSETNRTVVYYLEAVKPSDKIADQRILFSVDPDGTNRTPARFIAADAVRVTIIQTKLAMDGNRDDTIDFDDPNDAKYLFWVNDDHDCLHYEESEWHEDDSLDWADGADTPNCNDDRIGAKGYIGGNPPSASENHCRRDLEDFTRLHIRVDDNTANLPGITYWMKVENLTSGSPSVNIFEAINEDLDYLQNGSIADQQIQKTKLITVGAAEVQLPSQYIKTGNQRSPFILEGKTAGKGDLTFIVKKDGTEICKKAVTLELRPITKFYQVFQVATVGQNSTDVSAGYNADFTSSDDYFLFVHGFNVNATDKTYWPGTVFKRLWWQGYKGHVGFFDWPCVMFNPLNLQCYDDSEFNALRCAAALNNRIDTLNSGASSGKVRLLAHSQGNVILGEALHLASSQIVHTYIASQAAVASDAYQGGLPLRLGSPDTPNVYLSYPPTSNPWLAGISTKAGQCFSYFNPDDYALTSVGFGSWEWNNAARPDAFYHYEGPLDTYDTAAVPTPSRFYYDVVPLIPPAPRNMVFPDEEYEIYSYAAESRFAPLGMQSAMNDFSEVDLTSMPLPYDDRHYSHSRQFRSNIIDEWSYWERVILNCGF